MLIKELFVDILALHKQGISQRTIAKQLGISRNTVKKYIEQNLFPIYSKRPTVESKLDKYKAYLLSRIEAARPQWIPAVVLFSEIKQQGYLGGISILRYFVAQYKVQNTEPLIRFETEPGEQLQIDFTTIRRGKNPIKAFVATLGYSRVTYVRFFNNETTDSWIKGLQQSFEYFGGVTRTVLCDNAKALILDRDYYGVGKHRMNSKMLELSKDYGFIIKACRPYRAKTKGKVERFNHYLKNSFVLPLATTLKQSDLELDVDILNAKIGQWLEQTAHQRIHGTSGQKPQILLKLEQPKLLPLPVIVQSSNELADHKVSIIAPYNPIQHNIDIYQQYLEVNYAVN